MKAILLSSMGAYLDNIDNVPPDVFYYTSITDNVIYNPSLKKLYYVKKGISSPPLNSNEILIELALLPNQLFKNAFSNRVYRWSAEDNDMVEIQVPTGETVDTSFMIEIITTSNVSIETASKVFLEGSVVVFKGEGKYKNYHITGNNTQIIALNDNAVFEQCTFNGTFCYSNLKATNFGCVSGITETAIQWEYGAAPHLTTDANVKQYGGPDNTDALTSIGQFCSGSDHVRIEFNGDFFSVNADSPTEKVSPVVINEATDLELCGTEQPVLSALRIKDANGNETAGANTANDAAWSTLSRLVTGFKLVNCSGVDVHHISFIGLHTPHVFPPRYGNAESFSPTVIKEISGVSTLVVSDYWVKWGLKLQGDNSGTVGEGYTLSNTYCYANDGVVGISVAAVSVSTDLNKTSGRVSVHDCNFTMRCNGVCFGGYDSHAALKDVSGQYVAVNSCSDMRAWNCRADHIYWQPVGFHCTGGYASDFLVDYCGQPIDISTFSNHCTVERVVAGRCGIGPKQECNTSRVPSIPAEIARALTRDNRISNCAIGITDDIFCVDIESYILLAAQGAAGSHFIAEDCRFEVCARKKTFTGIIAKDENVTIRNTDFYVDVQTKWNLSKSKLDYVNPITNLVENNYRCIYQYEGGLLNTDIPELFYGDRHGNGTTRLTLENVTVNMTAKTSVGNVFSDLLNLHAHSFRLSCSWTPDNSASRQLLEDVRKTTARDRNVQVYMYKVTSSLFVSCRFTPRAQYFSHSQNYSILMRDTILLGLKNIAFCLKDNKTDGIMAVDLKGCTVMTTNTLFNIYNTGKRVEIRVRGNESVSCATVVAGKKEDPDKPTEGTLERLCLDFEKNQLIISGYEAFRIADLDDHCLINERSVNVKNNIFTGTRSGSACEVIQKDAHGSTNPNVVLLRPKYAHLFYRNWVSGNMNSLDEGLLSDRPWHPYAGMIFHDTTDSEHVVTYSWNGSGWTIVI